MIKLPGWAIDNDASVRHEAEPYLGLTPQQRAALTAMACRAAARQLLARPDHERLLAYRDPLPESTVQLLTRLRALAQGPVDPK